MALTFHKSGHDEVCALCDQPIASGESRWRWAKGADVSYEHTSCPEEHLTARMPDGLYSALGTPLEE